MHFTGVLLLICLSIGTVSSFSLGGLKWPPWSSGSPKDSPNIIIEAVCTYFSQHPDRAAIAISAVIQNLNSTNATAQVFVQTLAYLSDPNNQAKLVGGTSTCPTFFDEVNKALLADWMAQTGNATDAKQKAANTLNNLNTIWITFIK